MIPEFPEFKPLDLADKEFLLACLARKNPAESELSAGNLFIWNDFDRPQLTMIYGNLCLLLSPPNEPPFFLEPLGEKRIPETVEVCLGHIGRLSRVSERFAAALADGAYRLCTIRSQYDYLYRRQELAELKGKKFDGKRNHIKRFKAAHPGYEFLPLVPEMRKEAFALFERWSEERRDSAYFQRLACASQRQALLQAFDLFQELDLVGGIIRERGAVQGLIIGSRLNRDTATVHFQYGDPHFSGVSPTILWEAAVGVFAPFSCINLEQDLGIPGLRTAKLSFQPLKLVKKFQVEKAAE